MRRVRVLVASHTAALWGAERALLALGPRLADRGIDVTIASPDGPFAEAWRNLGLCHHRLDLPTHGGLKVSARHAPREAWVTARWIDAVRRLAPSLDTDVVQSGNLWIHPEVAAAGRLARRASVLHVQDLIRPGPGRRVMRGAVGMATVTVAITRAVAASIGARDPSRVAVLHPGVDTDRFVPGPAATEVRQRLGGVDGSPLVGILGRLDPEKGIDVVVDAVSRLPGVRLAVVGAPHDPDTAYRDRVRCQAEALLGDRVCFVPPTDDVVGVLRALDVLVSASWAEPYGLTVVEAQACGVPVVATAAGGVPEIVDDGRTGVLVTPGDADAMAAAITRLLPPDSVERAKVVAAARADVVERHSLDQYADRWASLYRGLVDR